MADAKMRRFLQWNYKDFFSTLLGYSSFLSEIFWRTSIFTTVIYWWGVMGFLEAASRPQLSIIFVTGFFWILYPATTNLETFFLRKDIEKVSEEKK